jgi:hypothetical protein
MKQIRNRSAVFRAKRLTLPVRAGVLKRVSREVIDQATMKNPIGLPAKESSPDYQPDRRLTTRYPVHGSVVLETEDCRYEGEPVDISFGGILFTAERLPLLDTQGRMQLNIDGFGEIITADVRVIRADITLAAALFIFPQASLVRCIAWLAHKQKKLRSCLRRSSLWFCMNRTRL